LDYITCHGNGIRHCCWFKGVECPFIEKNTVPDRRWSCGLFNELQDWDKVLQDVRYLKQVVPLFGSVPELKGMNCRDWPQLYIYYTSKIAFFPDGSCCEEVKA